MSTRTVWRKFATGFPQAMEHYHRLCAVPDAEAAALNRISGLPIIEEGLKYAPHQAHLFELVARLQPCSSRRVYEALPPEEQNESWWNVPTLLARLTRPPYELLVRESVGLAEGGWRWIYGLSPLGWLLMEHRYARTDTRPD